jgi:hypothetical protein
MVGYRRVDTRREVLEGQERVLKRKSDVQDSKDI